MPRLFKLVIATLLVFAPIAGCGPSLSERELGDVEYGKPKILTEENAQEASKDAALPAASQPTDQPALEKPVPNQPAPEQPSPESAAESTK